MRTLTPGDCVARYGEPLPKNEGKYMVLWDVPADINEALPVVPNKIYCNKDLVKPLEKSFRNIIARGLGNELKTWDGCFNVRKMRGRALMSIHSWGAAIDINAATNRLGQLPTMSKAFAKCFTDAGLEWGGNWLNRPDGMHFQLPG